jgi:hypothetical protein
MRFCPVFYDGWHLQDPLYAPEHLRRKLNQGIKQSAFTTAFLSPGYLDSEWCCYEWRATEAEHENRHFPAPDFSILPICWKRDLKQGEGCAPEILRRRYLDISDAFHSNSHHHALEGAVRETVSFLAKWFPEGVRI